MAKSEKPSLNNQIASGIVWLIKNTIGLVFNVIWQLFKEAGKGASDLLSASAQSSSVEESQARIDKIRREIQRLTDDIDTLQVHGDERTRAKAALAKAKEDAVGYYEDLVFDIQKHMQTVHREYSEFYEAWTGKVYPDGSPVVLRDEEVRTAKRYKLGGLLAAIAELILGAFLLAFNKVPLPLAIIVSGLFALGSVGLFDKFILAAIEDDTAPKKRLKLLRHFVLIPGGVFFAPLVLAFLLARVTVITGAAAFIFSVALSSGAIGCVLMSIALFAMSEIYGWSEQKYKIMQELSRLHREAMDEMKNYEPKPSPPSAPPFRQNPPSRSSTIQGFLWLSLLLLAAGNTACTSSDNVQREDISATPRPSPVPASARVSLHFEIDRSGSIDKQAADAAAKNLHKQVEELILGTQATEVSVTYFRGNGWAAPAEITVEVPRYHEPPPLDPRASEGDLLNPRAKAEALENERKEALKIAQDNYAAAMKEALAKIPENALNPSVDVGKGSDCSNVYGALGRIATRRGGRHIDIILTDGYNSCKNVTTIPMPEYDATTLVLLVEANPAQEKLAKTNVPMLQYVDRVKALKSVAPWLTIIPGYEQHLIDQVSPANSNAK